MKLAELKHRIILIAKCYKHSEEAIKMINDSFNEFEQYEKENQAEKTNIEKEIFELSCFRKKFGECLDDQRNDLNLLKKHILDLQDELGTLKRDLKFEKEQEKTSLGHSLIDADKVFNKELSVYEKEKPKQERFYYQLFHDGVYCIADRKNNNFNFNEAQAIEICKALNKMEGGK